MPASLPTVLTISFTLFAAISCTEVCGKSGSCSGTVPVQASHQAASLIQVRSKRPSAVNSGFLLWQTIERRDEASVLPPLRERPPCEISNLTGGCLPSFMVIGNQKAGTSTLFNILRTHPQVRTAFKKELLWFNGNFEKLRCSPPDTAPKEKQFKRYLSKFPVLLANASQVMGEFSATYLHCWCCPASMRRLMPGLRLVAQLRDPIERARSRWTEQHTWAKKIKTYSSFEEYVDKTLPQLEECLRRSEGSLEWETHCAAKSNILGLSLYDSAIGLWLRHTNRRDFLVTFLENLAVSPQSVVSSIHHHLGIEDRQYDPVMLQKRYNAKGHYGWRKAKTIQTLQMANANTSALERLYSFYRPHMKRLKSMADEGLISRLPSSWVARWSL